MGCSPNPENANRKNLSDKTWQKSSLEIQLYKSFIFFTFSSGSKIRVLMKRFYKMFFFEQINLENNKNPCQSRILKILSTLLDILDLECKFSAKKYKFYQFELQRFLSRARTHIKMKQNAHKNQTIKTGHFCWQSPSA